MRERILIIDDEEHIRRMVRLTLEPNAPKGQFAANLVFHTDSQKVPKIEVMITGEVQ